jgi:hypothetical protein
MKKQLLFILFTLGLITTSVYSQSGFTCNEAIAINTLPYQTSDDTANYGDTYDVIQPTGCVTSSGNYMGGNDVFYSYTPVSTEIINIRMTPSAGWSGIFVYDGCSNLGVTCVAGMANSSTTVREILGLTVLSGHTYVIAISTYPTPQTVAYSLTVSNLNCQTPTQLSSSGITQTSIDLTWNNPSNSTSWEVYSAPCGTIAPSATSVGTIVTTNPYTKTGLTAGTCYNFYVRSICGNNETSNWSLALSSTTLPIPIVNPLCGEQFYDNGGATANYSNSSDNTYTICPTVPGEFVTVTFSSFDTESSWDGLYVFNGNSIASPQIASTNPAGSVPGGLAGAFWGTTIPGPFVSSDSSGCLTFRFRSDGSVNKPGWVASVSCGIITCPAPNALTTSGITTNSINLNWTENGSATSWEVVALPCGMSPGTSTTGTITSSNNYVATELLFNTCYNFFVRSICSTSDMSYWSTAASATTSLVTLPPLVTNTTQYTNEQLVSNILVNNPCVTISNVTSSTGTNFGSVNGIGYFTNTNPSFPISSGLVLSSGSVANVPGPNLTTLSDGITAWTGDPALEAIITAATGQVMVSHNASKLEFDFTSLNEFMSFDFLFASDEYGTYQCTYSDAFAFLLTDLATGITTNLAVVPGTTDPVSVVTIRDNAFNTACSSVNPGFFDTYFTGNANYTSATNFNGQTALMTAFSPILPNHPYHIKLVVADRADDIFDSAVFIKSGSFTSGPPECTDKIQLVAFIDDNNNGVKDSGENDYNYGSFVVEQNNDGVQNYVTSPVGNYTIYDSNSSNVYDFSYQVNSEYAPYYTASSVNFNDVSIASGSGTQTFYFPITLTQGFNDVTVSISPLSPPRPGFNYTNRVVYKNLGVASTSGTMNFVKDPAVTIANVSQSGIVNNASGFSYDFANLQPYEVRSFNVTMSVPDAPVVNLNDLLTNSASISAPANDINLSNNTYSNTQLVVASYDPNDISEAHGRNIQFNQFTANDYLYYTIRFQNTGTANAINVHLENSLDSKLDENSIRMVSASHNYIMERVNNQVVWKLDYINLVSNLQNEELSKGYVTYKIKVKPGFAVGDIIPNTASIYFDSNPAIITNTFHTEFVAALANASFESNNFVIFPNPANNNVQLFLQNTSETINSILITDVLGKSIRKIKDISNNQISLDVSDLSQGVYLVEITTDNNLKQVKKLIIE